MANEPRKPRSVSPNAPASNRFFSCFIDGTWLYLKGRVIQWTACCNTERGSWSSFVRGPKCQVLYLWWWPLMAKSLTLSIPSRLPMTPTPPDRFKPFTTLHASKFKTKFKLKFIPDFLTRSGRVWTGILFSKHLYEIGPWMVSEVGQNFHLTKIRCRVTSPNFLNLLSFERTVGLN